MTNWKTFKTFGSERVGTGESALDWYRVEVDGWIEFSDGYDKYIEVRHLPIINKNIFRKHTLHKEYIEIDIDKTKSKGKGYTFESDVLKLVPWEVVEERKRDEMIRVSSADPTALAITREGMNRVDNNSQREFEYGMEDNSGNKHHWIYRKN